MLPRVWLKAFWGFDPGNEGYLGFTRSGDRDSFLEEARPGDLVLIYGADTAETAAEDRRQALGFLEVERAPISDRDRISAQGLKWKLESGWGDRWTFAVPIIRAWRVNRRIEVKHIAPTTYIPARARVIAARGELMTTEEALNSLKLPVSPVNVFGQQPINLEGGPEFTLQSVFAPSRGFTPSFGSRTSEYEDGEHFLYMLQIDGDAGALLDRPPGQLTGKVIVKVGLSRDPSRRCDDHNKALPPAGRLWWRLKFKSMAFANGEAAKAAEDAMKARFDKQFESLGGEFFLGSEADLASAFISAAAPAAFLITASRHRA